MTKTEERVLRNVIRRLKCEPIKNWGGVPGNTQQGESDEVRNALRGDAAIYLDTWVIPALELLLPGDRRDPALAQRLSGR